MGIKTYQEKNTKPMKKELAQSDIPVIFDPIMGIFKFSDPRWRVKEVEFSKNLLHPWFLSTVKVISTCSLKSHG